MKRFVVHHVLCGLSRKTTVEAEKIRLSSEGSVEGRCSINLVDDKDSLIGIMRNVEAIYLEDDVVRQSVNTTSMGVRQAD